MPPFPLLVFVVLRFSFVAFRPPFRLFTFVIDADTAGCSPRIVLFSIDSLTRHPGPARVSLLLVGPCTISVLDIPQCYLFVVLPFAMYRDRYHRPFPKPPLDYLPPYSSVN